jgi:HEAT repeat protein
VSRAARIGIAALLLLCMGGGVRWFVRHRDEHQGRRSGPTDWAGGPASARAPRRFGSAGVPAGDPRRTAAPGAAAQLIDRLVQVQPSDGPTRDEDQQAWAAIEAQLLQQGEAAVPALIARLDTVRNPSTYELLFHVLRQLPGAAASERVIFEARNGKTPAARTMAIETLAQRPSDAAFDTLAVIARTDPTLPARPLLARPRDPSDPSTELPDQRSFTPRMQAMLALASTRDPRAIEVLVDVLTGGPDESLRMEAARDLTSLHSDARAAAALRRAAMSDPSAFVRLAALHAMAGVTDPAWLQTLAAIANSDRDAGVRALAQRQLATTTPP